MNKSAEAFRAIETAAAVCALVLAVSCGGSEKKGDTDSGDTIDDVLDTTGDVPDTGDPVGEDDADPIADTPDVGEDTLSDTIEDPVDTVDVDVLDASEEMPALGRPGDACDTDEDCATIYSVTVSCRHYWYTTEVPNGYCTGDCSYGDSADCGPGSVCVDADILGFCLDACDDSSDCREEDGFVCQETNEHPSGHVMACIIPE